MIVRTAAFVGFALILVGAGIGRRTGSWIMLAGALVQLAAGTLPG